MVRSAKQVYRLTGRAAMYSPGAPSLGHEIERRFWQQIATGITSEKAAEAVGASQAVGSRWFRYRGGMPLLMSKPIAGRYLSFAEREEIALLSVRGLWVREIARRIGRSPSTVTRELTRNAATRSGFLEYRASVAQWKADRFAERPKPVKLATNTRLRQYVQERLEGKVHDADGRAVAGPKQALFKGRSKPHRGDRKWVYEHDFLDCSFGFRPGRSAHEALRSVWKGIMYRGGQWVLDVDVRKYFDSIVHVKL